MNPSRFSFRIRHVLGLFLVTAGIGAAVLFFRYSSTPYLYLAVIGVMVCIYVTAVAARPWIKAAWFNLGVIVLALGIAELYFAKVFFADEPQHEDEYRGVFSNDDDLLGYAAVKGGTASHLARFAGEVIYNVTYTIDEHGQRISPPVQAPRGQDTSCVLFFGDSYMFGLGVNDTDTMPYRVGQKSHGQYQVFNFGFPGYGPHQMLAQLQAGLVESSIRCTPRWVIYLAIRGHVARAAGLEVWDQHGPKFVVAQDGSLSRVGHFDDGSRGGPYPDFRRIHSSLIPHGLARILERSALYKGLLYRHRAVQPEDIDLFLRIVDESRRDVERRYPRAQFHVLFWEFNYDDETEINMIQGLQARDIALHRASAILPDFATHPERYWIHAADGHPNPRAYDLLAEYIVTRIINSSPRQ